jgi:microcin C transport system substrate-binding protein
MCLASMSLPGWTRSALIGLGLIALAASPALAQDGDGVVQDARLFMEFGEPQVPADFQVWPYANADAPVGGRVEIGTIGTFDTMNFIPLGGQSPRSIFLIYDSLMAANQDQVGAFYPLVAESLTYAGDFGWVEFTLDPAARFHDGEPITADDVAWTFETIMEVGAPFLQAQFDDVESVTVVDSQTVRFDFATTGRRQPVAAVAGLPILPAHWWQENGHNPGEALSEAPLGSGPYALSGFQMGRSLTYQRVEDYWAWDRPVMRGLYNFEEVAYEYYRDRTVWFEAFIGGEYDFRVEFSSANWATGYDAAPVEDGRILRAEIPAKSYRGLQGFFFNTRRAPFEDVRVREALNWLYPYEFVRQNVMYGLRQRITSYFPGADEYSWSGLPTGAELEILEGYRGQIPDWIFTEQPLPPPSENPRGPGVPRQNVREALALMEAAGWVVEDGAMVNAETGEPLEIEVLMRTAVLEPHTAPWIEQLARIGIDASIRLVDPAQFQLRYQERDFDVVSFAHTFNPPPGPQLRNRYHSSAAAINGTANIAGVADPVIDDLLDRIVAAETEEERQPLTQALDRLLMAGWYAVPHWYSREAWVAYWDRFGFPDEQPRFNFGLPNSIAFQPTWWIDPERDAALQAGGR